MLLLWDSEMPLTFSLRGSYQLWSVCVLAWFWIALHCPVQGSKQPLTRRHAILTPEWTSQGKRESGAGGQAGSGVLLEECGLSAESVTWLPSAAQA